MSPTARHEATVYIPNCRYIVFQDGYAYVSSYAGPVKIDPTARLGYVAKVDTATMQIVDTCTVGYQPEEMVIAGNKLYVANSGGYRVPNYDRTVSVIDLTTFTEIKKIDVAINLHRLELDRYGNIYVSSRGDYYDTPSKTYVIDSRTDEVTDILHLLPNSNMTLAGDSLYVYSTEWSWYTEQFATSYAIVDTRTKKIVTRNFITDGTDAEIEVPYGIAVNPDNGDFFCHRRQRLCDAGQAPLLRPARKAEMVGHDRRHSGTPRIHPQTAPAHRRVTGKDDRTNDKIRNDR